jgi:hypothetical protein
LNQDALPSAARVSRSYPPSRSGLVIHFTRTVLKTERGQFYGDTFDNHAGLPGQ